MKRATYRKYTLMTMLLNKLTHMLKVYYYYYYFNKEAEVMVLAKLMYIAERFRQEMQLMVVHLKSLGHNKERSGGKFLYFTNLVFFLSLSFF